MSLVPIFGGPPMVEKPFSPAREALEIVHGAGARQESYGHPLDNHECTAVLWRAWALRRFGVDIPFDGEAVCAFNRLQKESRNANAPKPDNLTDICGFAENEAMLIAERARRANQPADEGMG